MNPFLLSPRPGSQLCPLFLCPGGGHKGKRNKKFCSLLLRAGGGHKGKRNNGAGGVEKGSKGLTVVECPGSTVSPWTGCGEPGSGVSG